MLQTLFIIPHWLFEGPLLIAWLILGAVIFGWLLVGRKDSGEAFSFLPVYLVVSAIIYFILPRVEISGINPDDPLGPAVPLGLAIRGYGVFLLMAIVLGVSLAAARCHRIGLNTDQIMQLAFWMLITGIAGARLFYVIQKRESFFDEPFSSQTLVSMVDMTKGGLVVYGSLIGGTLGAAVFFWLRKLPPLKTVDLIAPGMVLGLAIGRLGCLMNGCCFGGVCEPPYPAVTFPAGSPPYMQQLVNGELLGITRTAGPDEAGRLTVGQVAAGSVADRNGIQPGDDIAIIPPSSELLKFYQRHPNNQEVGQQTWRIDLRNAGAVRIPINALPVRSARTHPTQIYSAINALLLCGLLWFFWTMPHYDGQVFGLMLILYAIARYLMELVRVDEAGQFGTSMTISQWVSLVMLVAGSGLMVYAWKFSSLSETRRVGG